MNKKLIRLTESDLHRIVRESVNKVLREDNDFSKRYADARFNASKNGRIWGIELKNPEGEWEYGDIEFNPQTMQMSCMGVTIEVDGDWSIDEALGTLIEELYCQGYGGED